jgi:hypothetical protein
MADTLPEVDDEKRTPTVTVRVLSTARSRGLSALEKMPTPPWSGAHAAA